MRPNERVAGQAALNGDAKTFWLGFWWVIIFLGSLAYCIATYGLLYGGGLGWLPSAIVATAAVAVWTLVRRLFGDTLWMVFILGIVIAVIYAALGHWPHFR